MKTVLLAWRLIIAFYQGCAWLLPPLLLFNPSVMLSLQLLAHTINQQFHDMGFCYMHHIYHHTVADDMLMVGAALFYILKFYIKFRFREKRETLGSRLACPHRVFRLSLQFLEGRFKTVYRTRNWNWSILSRSRCFTNKSRRSYKHWAHYFILSCSSGRST